MAGILILNCEIKVMRFHHHNAHRFLNLDYVAVRLSNSPVYQIYMTSKAVALDSISYYNTFRALI